MNMKKAFPALLLVSLAASIGFATTAQAVWGKPGTKKLYYASPAGGLKGKQEWYCNGSFQQTGATTPYMVYIDYGCGA